MNNTENQQKKKIAFYLKAKDKSLYYKEVLLEDFQHEIIKEKKLSFFYFFKDLSIELDEKLSKMNKTKGEKAKFYMEFEGKIINEIEIETEGLTKEILKKKKNEIELCFFFERKEEELISLINKEHLEVALDIYRDFSI